MSELLLPMAYGLGWAAVAGCGWLIADRWRNRSRRRPVRVTTEFRRWDGLRLVGTLTVERVRWFGPRRYRAVVDGVATAVEPYANRTGPTLFRSVDRLMQPIEPVPVYGRVRVDVVRDAMTAVEGMNWTPEPIRPVPPEVQEFVASRRATGRLSVVGPDSTDWWKVSGS